MGRRHFVGQGLSYVTLLLKFVTRILLLFSWKIKFENFRRSFIYNWEISESVSAECFPQGPFDFVRQFDKTLISAAVGVIFINNCTELISNPFSFVIFIFGNFDQNIRLRRGTSISQFSS